ncbi:MAG: YkgJ family cysteine cluster protein [Spirochaetota bacterium]
MGYQFSFACKRCGQCCRDRGFVYFSRDDIRRAAKSLRIGEKDFMKGYLFRRGRQSFIKVGDDGCPLLTANGCRIQDGKPEQCATFPYWKDYVDEDGRLINFDRDCPGIAE